MKWPEPAGINHKQEIMVCYYCLKTFNGYDEEFSEHLDTVHPLMEDSVTFVPLEDLANFLKKYNLRKSVEIDYDQDKLKEHKRKQMYLENIKKRDLNIDRIHCHKCGNCSFRMYWSNGVPDDGRFYCITCNEEL